MTEIAVDGLKRQLRLLDDDVTDDDVILLQQCLDAAESYIKGAIGDNDAFYSLDTVTSIYPAAVYALATSYYQNPASLTTGNVVEVNQVLNSLIAQMRGKYALYMSESGDDDGTTSQPQPTQ